MQTPDLRASVPSRLLPLRPRTTSHPALLPQVSTHHLASLLLAPALALLPPTPAVPTAAAQPAVAALVAATLAAATPVVATLHHPRTLVARLKPVARPLRSSLSLLLGCCKGFNDVTSGRGIPRERKHSGPTYSHPPLWPLSVEAGVVLLFPFTPNLKAKNSHTRPHCDVASSSPIL